MNGYTGKILRVGLTDKKISFIETEQYEAWGGGHGLGSAIFWDLVKDKTIDGYDPRNIVTIMTSPLTGTMTPGGASRTEIQGIGVQAYPIPWFTRSNVGGRFGAMLKYAGWDGIVIEGKAAKPVWLDIQNEKVIIREAGELWGLDTWEAQKKIWRDVSEKAEDGWFTFKTRRTDGRTTQKPAVLVIGPAGENLSRLAAIIHDAGNAAGQGGFGAVWGAKNLKAISVFGTQSVKVNQPSALLEARQWVKKYFTLNLSNPDDLTIDHTLKQTYPGRTWSISAPPAPIVGWQRPKKSRPQACLGCPAGCRARNDTRLGNESGCIESQFYSYPDLKKHGRLWSRIVISLLERLSNPVLAYLFARVIGKNTSAAFAATDLAQRLGINASELIVGIPYIKSLNEKGLLGPGRQIDCDLPFDQYGEFEFADQLLHKIAYRQGIGKDLAEGFFRAAKKWNRLGEDLRAFMLSYPYWGLPDHYDPRFQIDWGYGSILGDRDINEHDFNMLFWLPTSTEPIGKAPFFEAEKLVKIHTDKMVPFDDDPLMLDYSTDNIYSEHIVKLVAWHRYYTRFWKQSMLFCDFLYPDFLNMVTADNRGMVGQGEPKFFNAVTGKDFSFVDGIDLGKKIWALDNAIWTLQGRHRDMVCFADYIYNEPLKMTAYVPGTKDGQWQYINVKNRTIDKDKFEAWKTKYYKFEGWDPKTGWPTRKSLKALGLEYVADELEANQRLGRA